MRFKWPAVLSRHRLRTPTTGRPAQGGVRPLQPTTDSARTGTGPQPRLTVVTSTYNKEKYVADAIDSVLAQQTTFPFKLIVTDDASTDRTSEIVEGYRRRRPDLITVLRQRRNSGGFENLLRAFDAARTDYLSVLDADDFWIDSRHLQRAFDFLEAHPDFTVYSTNCWYEWPDGSRSLFVPEHVDDRDFTFENLLREDGAVFVQSTGTTFRNVMFEFGVPELFWNLVGTTRQPSFKADMDRFILHLAKGRGRYERAPTGVYRVTGDGVWTGMNDFEKALSEAQAKLDYWWYFDYQHPSYFLAQALMHCQQCLTIMSKVAAREEAIPITADQAAELWRLVNECLSHRDLLAEEEPSDQGGSPIGAHDDTRVGPAVGGV